MFETKKGTVHIESKLSLDRIQELVLATDFTTHAAYRPIYISKEILEGVVAKGGNVALAILENKTIVGFAILDCPDPEERWARLNENVVEVKVVEVLREFRNHGIARHLLFHLLSDPGLEQKIICLTAYSWTWDLESFGQSIQAYKNMLISLYAGFGFMEYQTNEPNICLRPENFLMARIGKNVLQTIQEAFKWARFGLSPDDSFVQ